jgi:hypothetical protein
MRSRDAFARVRLGGCSTFKGDEVIGCWWRGSLTVLVSLEDPFRRVQLPSNIVKAVVTAERIVR